MKCFKVLCFTIFTLGILLSVPSLAQQSDSSLLAKTDSIHSSLDSLQLPSLDKADSLKAFANNKLDSIQSLSAAPFDSINTIQSQIASKLDSLSPQHKIDQINSKIGAVQQKLSSKMDSLTTFNFGNNRVARALDSLQMPGPIKTIKKAEDRVEDVQSGIATKIGGVEDKINEPLGKFAENGANIPGSVNLPGVEQVGGIPEVNMPGANIPGVGLDGADATGLDGLGGSGQLPNLPQGNLDMGNLSVPKVGELNPDIGAIGEVGKDMKGYQGDIKGASEWTNPDKISSAVETKVQGMEGVDQLQQVDYAAMVKKWNSDPDVAKEMVVSKAKEEAINHFAGHEQELKTVMEQLSKLKSKRPDTEGVIDLFAKKKVSLKNKTFAERLVPGISIQLLVAPVWWFDFNPYVGYKLNERFTGGVGWNERLAVNFKEWHTVSKDRIYGPRVYVEFKWKEHIALKAETEWMNTNPKEGITVPVEWEGRNWVQSTFVGIKNMFNFSETTKGHVHIMYNLLDRDNRSPYVSKINVRFGFEFPIRKTAKETELKPF